MEIVNNEIFYFEYVSLETAQKIIKLCFEDIENCKTTNNLYTIKINLSE